MQKSGLHFASVETIKENIIHVSFFDLAEIDIEDAKALKQEILRLSGANNYVLVLDSGKQRIDISHAARDFLVSDQQLNEKIICQAYVAKSMSNKLIFHFFINFHKPDFPVQVFDSSPDALKWIEKEMVKQ